MRIYLIETGRCLANILQRADLAILGHNSAEATDRLTMAAAGHTAGNTRAQAVCLTKLASLTMATGDPIHAAAIGHEALDVAGTLRSRGSPIWCVPTARRRNANFVDRPTGALSTRSRPHDRDSAPNGTREGPRTAIRFLTAAEPGPRGW